METIYLQLYSLGQYGEQHPMKDNLKEVAAMGYDGVEFAGNNYGGMSADELKAELAANHLGCRSVHLSMDQIVPTLPFLKEIGCEYAIVAMHAFSDMEETLDCARQLNEAAKEAAKYGIKVGYHNHTQEFNKLGDKYMLEVLIENTDPENVVFELDCGWATAAGIDAAAFIKQYADRFAAIHVKENSKVIGPEKPRSPKDPSPFKLDEMASRSSPKKCARCLRNAQAGTAAPARASSTGRRFSQYVTRSVSTCLSSNVRLITAEWTA